MTKNQRIKDLIKNFRNKEATWYLGVLGESGKFISTDSIQEAAEFIVKHQEPGEGCTIMNNVNNFSKMRESVQLLYNI